MNNPRLLRSCRWRLLLAALCAGVATLSPAEAQIRKETQIYEWVDRAGTHHFTNSLESVPEEARARAQLFAEQGPVSSSEHTAPLSKVDEAPVTVVYQVPGGKTEPAGSGSAAAFDVGWISGYNAAVEHGAAVCPAEPPVVLTRGPELMSRLPLYDPSGQYYRSPYAGTVSVPFDRGRTFGLTRRQQAQERRRLERER